MLALQPGWLHWKRPDGAYDFLPAGGGEPHGYEEFFASVDALVIGRNTYEVVLPLTPWSYGTKPVFVLSNHPLKIPPAGADVERMSGPPEEIVSTLSQRAFEHIYVPMAATPSRPSYAQDHDPTRDHHPSPRADWPRPAHCSAPPNGISCSGT